MCDLTRRGAGLPGERRVLLVLPVRLVLAAGGVRGEVVAVMVVMLVVVGAAASCAGGVLVGAGGPGLVAGITGHSHQT